MKHIRTTLTLAILLGFNSTWGQTPNWAQHVAPILYNNCGSCHIPGAIGPFSIIGFTNTKNHGVSIKNKTQSREMPPWPANPEYKRYAHEKLLSGDEIKTIADWVDGGMPSGDTTLAPAAPTLPKGSTLQNPSLMVKMPNYTANTADDEYRCFVMPTGLTADKYLTEIEVIPGNLRAVHHVLVFHDTSTVPLQLDAATSEPGYVNFGGTGSNTSKLIGLWVPGQEPFFMPSGAGILIEKKGYIVFQVHYPKGLVNQLGTYLPIPPKPFTLTITWGPMFRFLLWLHTCTLLAAALKLMGLLAPIPRRLLIFRNGIFTGNAPMFFPKFKS